MLMKYIYSLTFILLITSCSSSHENSFIRNSVERVHITSSQKLYIKTDFQEDVKFQGQYDYDEVDLKSGSVAYPADTGAMFLASILAHALTADSIKNNVMSDVQNRANGVLAPYSKHLLEFENEELVSCVIKSIDDNYKFNIIKYAGEGANTGWLLKSKPVFFMTQDQKELVLKHAMYISHINTPEVVVHKNIVVISSASIESANLIDYWIKKNNLPRVSGELYAESIKLFIDDMLESDNIESQNKQKTFRYMQGGTKMYERGTLVKNECSRTTIKTLRGWIKSFPDNDDNAAGEECMSQSHVDHELLVDFSKI